MTGIGGTGAAVVLMSGLVVPFINDLAFPFYDFVVEIVLPGLWFPFKEDFCVDFADTDFG